MGCCISTAIGLSWTEDQLQEKAAKLTAAIKKVMAKNTSRRHEFMAIKSGRLIFPLC